MCCEKKTRFFYKRGYCKDGTPNDSFRISRSCSGFTADRFANKQIAENKTIEVKVLSIWR